MKLTLLVSALAFLGCCESASKYAGQFKGGETELGQRRYQQKLERDQRYEKRERERENRRVERLRSTEAKPENVGSKKDKEKGNIRDVQDELKKARANVQIARLKVDNNLAEAQNTIWDAQIKQGLVRRHVHALKLEEAEAKFRAARLEKDKADDKVRAVRAKSDNNHDSETITALNLAENALLDAEIELSLAEINVKAEEHGSANTNVKIAGLKTKKANANLGTAQEERDKAEDDVRIAQAKNDRAGFTRNRLYSNDSIESTEALSKPEINPALTSAKDRLKEAVIALNSASDEWSTAQIAGASAQNLLMEARVALSLAKANVTSVKLRHAEAKLKDAECKRKDAHDKVRAAQAELKKYSREAMDALSSATNMLMKADIVLSSAKLEFGGMRLEDARTKSDFVELEVRKARYNVKSIMSNRRANCNHESVEALELAIGRWLDIEFRLMQAREKHRDAGIAFLQEQSIRQQRDKSESLVEHQEGAADSVFGQILYTKIHQRADKAKRRLNDKAWISMGKLIKDVVRRTLNQLEMIPRRLGRDSGQAQRAVKNAQSRAVEAKKRVDKAKQQADKAQKKVDEARLRSHEDESVLQKLTSGAEIDAKLTLEMTDKAWKEAVNARILAKEFIELQERVRVVKKRHADEVQEWDNEFFQWQACVDERSKDEERLQGLFKDAQKLVVEANEADWERSYEKIEDQLNEVVRRINVEMDRRNEEAAQREAAEYAKNAQVGRTAETLVDRAARAQVDKVAEAKTENIANLNKAIGALLDEAQKQAVRAQDRADMAMQRLTDWKERLTKMAKEETDGVEKAKKEIEGVRQRLEKIFRRLEMDLQSGGFVGESRDEFMLIQMVNKIMRLTERAQNYVEHVFSVEACIGMARIQADMMKKMDAMDKQGLSGVEMMAEIIMGYVDTNDSLLVDETPKRLIYDSVKRIKEKAVRVENAAQ